MWVHWQQIWARDPLYWQRMWARFDSVCGPLVRHEVA